MVNRNAWIRASLMMTAVLMLVLPLVFWSTAREAPPHTPPSVALPAAQETSGVAPPRVDTVFLPYPDTLRREAALPGDTAVHASIPRPGIPPLPEVPLAPVQIPTTKHNWTYVAGWRHPDAFSIFSDTSFNPRPDVYTGIGRRVTHNYFVTVETTYSPRTGKRVAVGVEKRWHR